MRFLALLSDWMNEEELLYNVSASNNSIKADHSNDMDQFQTEIH